MGELINVFSQPERGLIANLVGRLICRVSSLTSALVKQVKNLKYSLFRPPSSSGAYILRSFYIGLSLFKGFHGYTSLALLKTAIAAVSMLALFICSS